MRPRYGERAEAAAGVYNDAGRQTINPHPKVRFGVQPGRAEVAKFNRRGHMP